MNALLSSFKSYLQQVGYSAGSVYMLPHCAGEFLAGINDVNTVTATDIQAFYEQLQVRPLRHRPGVLSGAMIDHYGYSLRVFYGWLEVTGQITINPVSGLRLPRQGAGGRAPLSTDQVTRLYECAGDERERVILHLFYSCGLRRSEAESLDCRDVWVRQQLLYVRSGKGARRRVIPLPGKVAACMGHYLASVKRKHAADSFIENRIGQRMRGDSFNHAVQQLGQRAGLDEVVTPHRLRHSIATHLLGRGMALEQVREFLGHQCLETTQLYAKPDSSQTVAL